MTEPDVTDRLLALAHEIARPYRAHPQVVAIAVVGSVARGWADRWSDIELAVWWQAWPTAAERADLALGAAHRRVYARDADLQIEEEDFYREGIKIDLSHGTVQDMETLLHAVTVQGHDALARHALVAGVRDALSLAGTDTVRRWQRQAAVYPDHLQAAMIERNLIFGPHRWLEMLAARDDRLLLQDVLVRIGRALLGIVLALNRSLTSSPVAKWMARIAQEQEIAPATFADRLSRMLQAPSAEAVAIARDLILETLDLVGRHLPDIDITAQRQRVLAAR